MYYITIGNFTLLQNFDYLVHITQLIFLEETLYQIMHMLSTLLLWSKNFYTTIANILPYRIPWPYHVRN